MREVELDQSVTATALYSIEEGGQADSWLGRRSTLHYMDCERLTTRLAPMTKLIGR